MLTQKSLPHVHGAALCGHRIPLGAVVVPVLRFDNHQPRCRLFCALANSGSKEPVRTLGTRKEQAESRTDEKPWGTTDGSDISRVYAEGFFKNADQRPHEQCGPVSVVQTMGGLNPEQADHA